MPIHASTPSPSQGLTPPLTVVVPMAQPNMRLELSRATNPQRLRGRRLQDSLSSPGRATQPRVSLRQEWRRRVNLRHVNRLAWDRQVDLENPWTIPVGQETIAKARSGEWHIVLTPTRPVPREWLGDVAGQKILCLASGGGQQGPVLAAAGAIVTVFDNSPRQLQQDRMVAQREGLQIETVEGTMTDLSVFVGEAFDTIVHPVSNCFIDDVLPVWREAARVLKLGGALLAGFNNPIVYAFDPALMESAGQLSVTHALPYSDLQVLERGEIDKRLQRGVPLEFSHTLQTLIGGQMVAGLVMTGLYEDHDRPGENVAINRYFSPYIATRSVKPKHCAGYHV